MNTETTFRRSGLVIALAIILAGGSAVAETDDTVTDPVIGTNDSSTTDTSTAATNGNVVNKLSSEFADFLGGEENARAVVEDLRDGSYTPEPPADEQLVGTGDDSALSTETGATTAAGAEPTTTGALDGDTVIAESKTTMGYGEIRHTLRLAQTELDKLGITQPTDAELAAMLNGGELAGSQVDGILVLRADGMGWGQIARNYGYTVGELMGNKPAHTLQTSKAAYSAGYIPSGKSAAISSAAGHGVAAKGSKKVSTAVGRDGYIPSGKGGNGHAFGRGVVTAGGASAASGGSHGKAHGHANTSAPVSAAGGGAATVASAAGSAGKGHGLAKGRSK